MSAVIEGARPFGRAKDLILVSAQTSAPGAGDSIEQQLKVAVDKIVAILSLTGAALPDLVKLTLFYNQKLVTREPEILSKLRSLLPESCVPVLTAIPLPYIPDNASFQVEATAIKPERRNTTIWQTTPGSYGFSNALRCGDLIFVGGQMSVDASGNTQFTGNIVAQAKATMANVEEALKALGVDLSVVARLNTYYVGFGTAADWSLAAQVRSDAFRTPGPGATGIPVPGPFPREQLIRQDAMGVVNDDGTAAERRTSWPKGVWNWPIPVSFQQGVEVNGLILPGGQVALTTTGSALFPNDLRRQTVNTMACMATILGGLGQNFDCIAKITVFYATRGDRTDVDTLLRCMEPFFAQGLPAVTLVPLRKLGVDTVEVEIEVIGAV